MHPPAPDPYPECRLERRPTSPASLTSTDCSYNLDILKHPRPPDYRTLFGGVKKKAGTTLKEDTKERLLVSRALVSCVLCTAYYHLRYPYKVLRLPAYMVYNHLCGGVIFDCSALGGNII